MTQPQLRIAFAGTPELARVILESILNKQEHIVEVVFTQPDRPAGRGRKITQSQVKQCALDHSIPVLQPTKSKDFEPNLLNGCDLLLVVAYGMILPAAIINKPPFGCINIHTSLLPRWRGAAPIQRAIESGDKETGITFMQMDDGLDTGPILMQKSCPINEDDTGGILHDRLAEISAEHIHSLLNNIALNKINPVQQDDSKACYANKISKQEAALDWNKPADVLERKVRAFNPFPVTHTRLNDVDMRIWEARIKINEKKYSPGTVIKNSKDCIDVATSTDILSITKLQLPGKKVISAKDFLNGKPDFLTV